MHTFYKGFRGQVNWIMPLTNGTIFCNALVVFSYCSIIDWSLARLFGRPTGIIKSEITMDKDKDKTMEITFSMPV